MKITHIYIRGYKNLNVDLDHKSDTMAIIGNNGSGKSNLLEALCLIFRSLYSTKYAVDFDYKIEFTNTNDKKICIEKVKAQRPTFLVDGNEQISISDYLPKRIVVIYSGEEDRLWRNYIDPFYNDYISEINKTSVQGIQSKSDNLPQILYINKFYWHIALLALISSDLPDNVSFVKNTLAINEINKIKFDFKQDNYKNYANSKTLQFIKHIDSKSEYTIQEFKDIMNTENYISDDIFKYLYVAFTPKQTKILDDIVIKFNNRLTIEDLSEGEKKLLLIKAALEFAGQEDTLFVLDEPDAHIHVGNKEEITKIFDPYKLNRQIVFTTHSPTLTNCIKDECLHMIDKGAFISSKKQEQLQLLVGDTWSKHQMNTFLSNTKKCVLLVEGKHDKIHICNAINKLRNDYPSLEFDIYSLNGEKKIHPFMNGLYESNLSNESLYIAVYDNDSAGQDSFNKNGFLPIDGKKYRKLKEDKISHNNFFACLLPKPTGYTSDCTIETMYDAIKYQKALRDSTNGYKYYGEKSIDVISIEIKETAKNLLAEESSTFTTNDFINFKQLFDIIVDIKNEYDSKSLSKTGTKKAQADVSPYEIHVYLNYTTTKAKAIYNKNTKRITVLKGSIIKLSSIPSFDKNYITAKAYRDRIINSDKVDKKGDICVLKEDIEFKTLREAVLFCTTTNLNSKKCWLDSNNIPLYEHI